MDYLYKILLFSAIIIVISTTSLHAAPSTEKSSVTDEQLAQVFNDKRYLKYQIACALNKGPCDAIGIRLKKQVPRVLLGTCPGCSTRDTNDIRKFIIYLQTKCPKEFMELSTVLMSGKLKPKLIN